MQNTIAAVTDTTILAIADADGYAAFGENRPAAPWSSAVVRELVGNREVGDGAAEIFAAYTAGFERARDEECARILAEN